MTIQQHIDGLRASARERKPATVDSLRGFGAWLWLCFYGKKKGDPFPIFFLLVLCDGLYRTQCSVISSRRTTSLTGERSARLVSERQKTLTGFTGHTHHLACK